MTSSSPGRMPGKYGGRKNVARCPVCGELGQQLVGGLYRCINQHVFRSTRSVDKEKEPKEKRSADEAEEDES
jgi:hypothetical protein